MLALRKSPLRPAARLLATHARGFRQPPAIDGDDLDGGNNEFILSILHASPSVRDTKSYRASFNLKPVKDTLTKIPKSPLTTHLPSDHVPTTTTKKTNLEQDITPSLDAVKQHVEDILDPVQRHTALVKIQGPFTDTQLESIARGMVYLEKLGLVSVIVVERDDWRPGSEHERGDAMEESLRVVKALEDQGARARPVLQAIARLGPKPGEEDDDHSSTDHTYEARAHALPEDLGAIRSALRAGEIPVLPPIALDSFCRTVRIDGNYVIAALARGMVEAAELDTVKSSPSSSTLSNEFDLTPLRLMIINREGGVPSYARSGLPHLLINLDSEFRHIQETFLPEWRHSHPTALANMRLAQACLSYMPRTSSAVVVSHRSPKSLIANLITNKPAQSSSLPHALLSGPKKVTPHTPTIIRHGLPMRVIRSSDEIDKAKMTALLESSFGRKLGVEAFFDRLDKCLDFAIVAGDYAGAAIVTDEGSPTDSIAYLDKFAVLPEHQGDGTVDFLWVALHDESYGLGLASALNPNVGGMQGRGIGRDLVWRSRGNNPVNKWYFERSSGHRRIGKDKEWTLFWCDAEERLKRKESIVREVAEKEEVEGGGLPKGAVRLGRGWSLPGLKFVEEDEVGRTEKWSKIVEAIPSCWI